MTVAEYILQAFPVVCIAIVMIIIATQNYRQDRFMSGCFIAIVAMALTLVVTVICEGEGVKHGNIPVATVATFLGYAIRPFCLFIFILLAVRQFGLRERIALIPLVANALIYATSLFLFYEPIAQFTFHYELLPGGTLQHVRGPMNFTSHILCALYLAWVVYLSLGKLRGKHRSDAFSIIICAAFIVASVIIEMTGLTMGVLNITIAVSCIFYYLFLLSEANRRDALTHLFDRKTYYSDLQRFDRYITGVIAVDMNGLKAINDTKGHEGGDAALSAIADCIEKSCARKMYIYRIGGDEFTILSLREKSEALTTTAEAIRANVESAGYSVSIGVAVRPGPFFPIDVTIAQADDAMYSDKARYYASHTEIDRRRNRK